MTAGASSAFEKWYGLGTPSAEGTSGGGVGGDTSGGFPLS